MTNPIDSGTRARGGIQGTSCEMPAQADRSNGRVAGTSTGYADLCIKPTRLPQIRDRIDATAEVDLERVAEIKQALAEGRLAADPQRIATKFVALESLLNGRAR